MADTLYLKQLECGPMQNYVYLIGDPATRQAAVVDPAWEVERIVQAAQADGYTISKVLITHTHQDHIGGQLFGNYIPGVVELLDLVDVPVHVHKTETHILQRVPDSSKVPTESHQVIEVGGNVQITVIHTPGHTPGSQCFLVQNQLVSGDTLFIGACGGLTCRTVTLRTCTIVSPTNSCVWTIRPCSILGITMPGNPRQPLARNASIIRTCSFTRCTISCAPWAIEHDAHPVTRRRRAYEYKWVQPDDLELLCLTLRLASRGVAR